MRPLRIGDEHEARAAHQELLRDEFTFLLGWEPQLPWADYVTQMENHRRGIDLPARLVASTFLLAEADGALIGRVSVRHELNDFLLNEGGHIGYAVRPAHRRHGYAQEILRQALIVARAEGVQDVLVTCDEDNLASVSVIERAGGVMEDVRIDEDGLPKLRYWIR
jgi:predicted acetyltransferase